MGSLSQMGYPGITVTEVQGCGTQQLIAEKLHGGTYKADLLSKVKIEIVVFDQHLDSIIQTIIRDARTGNVGDGKIFISDVENVTSIRTGETGDKAI